MNRFVLVCCVLTLASCQSPSTETATPDAPATAVAPTLSLTGFDPQVDELLAQMTLAEKVGQMTQANISALIDEADIETYFLGSLLSGGDSDPTPENTFDDWRDMYDRYQSRAVTTRLGIPILYGVDAVHGHSNVVGAVMFPHNVGLGATRDPDLVERVYYATAVEVRATGINWSFAPGVMVPRDERWGRTYEGFSEDPELVAELGAAAVRGLQGEGLGDPLGVLACAKHFAGDGGTVYGTGTPRADGGNWPLDRGDVRLDDAQFRAIHLPGYRAAVAAGVGSIMPSYSSWNGLKCSGNKYLMTEVLKGEMGFEGFLISDWAAIDELPGDYTSDVEQAINAGMDMVMVPDKYREFFTTLKQLAEDGRVPMERIDDAVRRILRVKFAIGLMDKSRSPLADRALEPQFGSAEHRELAREAVRKSLVLLKNDDATLPLAKDLARVHVAGSSADDMGRQCGGWTIKWQGESGDVTPGTTILDAIRATVGEGTEVTFSDDGTGAAGADVAVVVIGEEPYAEMFGDREDLSLAAADVAAVRNAAAAGVPVVTVLISGRPMILGETLEASDAFVAAWLPGTEGQGVADVLFGDYAPTGKLGYTWPRSNEQLPINVGDEGYDPLFAYGLGLSY